jgi:O-antigen/teichoic acid export membrane protein
MAESLVQRTIKNNIYSLIGFVWPLILSFVATPIIIRGLGSARFGFFALLNSILTLFSLLDFGISYTLTQKLSAKREHPEGPELSRLFGSTFILYGIIGSIVMLVLLLLPGVFQQFFKIPTDFISSFRLAFFILGLMFFLKMITVPLALIPYSLQRHDITVNISLVNNLVLQIGSVAAILTGHGVLSLLVIQLASAAFLFLCGYFVWRHLAPNLRLGFYLSRDVILQIGKQGFWVFFSNTMGNVFTQLDKFVLGSIWGPTAVGYYSTAQMIPEKISGTSFSLSHIFFPIFSEAAATTQEDGQKVKKIFRRSLGVIPVITAGLATLVLIYGYKLIFYWVSPEFANHTILAVKVLAVTYFLLGFMNFFNAFLGGLGALKFLAFSAMVVAITDLVFMFIFIPVYNVNGAAFAYLLSGLPIIGFLYYIERKYFASESREIFGFYGKLFGKIFFSSAISYLLGVILFRPFVNSLWLAVLFGGLNLIAYFMLFWCLGFVPREDKELVKLYFGKFALRFKFAKTDKF